MPKYVSFEFLPISHEQSVDFSNVSLNPLLPVSVMNSFIVVTENRLRNFFLQNCPLMNIIIFYAEIVYEKKADLQSFFVRVKGVAKSTFQVKISMQKLVIFQTQVFLQRV